MTSDYGTVVVAYAAVMAGLAAYAGYLALCQARIRRSLEEIRRIRAAGK